MATDIPTVITNERRRVADWLDELPDETWSGPSLCERWSVQDTVGHMTFPWRVSTPRLLAQMVRYRGFEEASAVTAAGLGDIGPEALVAQIRANVDNPKRPPGTKPEDLLAEVILHPLDIAIPNGQTWEPDPAWAAVEAQLGGAHGITFHLREDRRHIQDGDLRKLKGLTNTRLNMEMAATTEMLGIAIEVQPQMAMLVPEGRDEITTEGGLDVVGRLDELRPIVHALKGAGIPVSAFIDAEKDQISAAAECGFNVCELHTGPYAERFHEYGRAMADAESRDPGHGQPAHLQPQHCAA